MYQARYDEMLEDDQTISRRMEYRALDRCIVLLGKADAAGMHSRECVEALHWTRQLWQIFLLELADDGNALPNDLRARLISIGIWILKELEAVRLGRSTNVIGIAEICTIVRDGLR